MNNLTAERKKLFKQIENIFDVPLIVLGFVWLIVLVLEFVYGSNEFLDTISTIIWITFIIDFLIKFVIAPAKFAFLQSNILTIISLVIPAIRVFRIFRIIRLMRFSRSLRLIRVIGSLNRGMRALSATMSRRAFGYVILLTLIVIFAGAAGMYAFESAVPNGPSDYGTALWWTTMIITTLGSEYWPQTAEGRILCIILSLYAFAVFGYITATIATFFIGRDAESSKTELAGSNQIEALRQELREIKELIQEQRSI